ncbi:A-kinase anchor protein SPHKAP isoform X4 [Anolis carolinensis]|uniref:A-kinase anchor protein SPHKAP isoform X4 n=1 Tax=Anolis carolinensis TaxID=28377 RepID=UPI000462A5D6|nr:PREDICTED: A-kinase anchor protein SPHKAP isoform X4 [Anolis carolinensis]|eukprot:XP_008104442.1 PREDICTED: A-kinase anchor protein SPHKAP isoform X4 [Anolis carolinensis]
MAEPPTLQVPPSNFQSPLMYEASEHQSVGTDSSGSSLGSSVTACKKVLCSNSLLESTDYWLQNQKTPCRIGIVEDKLEKNYTSVCFVNLDAHKDDCDNELMKQKLVDISPNLPKLISSMNVQPPKENEIILLSGLTSGNLQSDFEETQCSWLADVCLVQCARGNRKNSTSCIIFEINKFLIGLELVREKQLHIEAGILKPEDDTNCSVSSIEEDFLTASEHFEDENEPGEYENGQDHLSITETVIESKTYRGKEFEHLHCHKSTLEANCINKDSHTTSARTSSSSEEECNGEGEIDISKTVDKAIEQLHWKVDQPGKSKPSSNTDCLDDFSDLSEDVTLTIMAKEEGISLDDATVSQNTNSDTPDCRTDRTPHLFIKNEQATAGQFATNLAESVLQDAFIRLSQSTFPKEAAISISVGNSLTSPAYATQNIMTPQSWSELPKIVIVQSPDGFDNNLEWPGSSLPSMCPWSEGECSSEDHLQDNSSSGKTQSALEVALACAATVIGTISSPHATEQLKREQESINTPTNLVDNEESEELSSQSVNHCTPVDYSFPSALCGMTQVASAVAVCGLGEKKDDKYPVTSGGLLSAAETSAAVTLRYSIAIGSSMEGLNYNIAQMLFKEASVVLMKPETYRNVGDFMESMNEKIVQAATKPSVPHLDEIVIDDLAQNLSNVILTHSVEEVRKKQLNVCSERNLDLHTQDVFISTVNKLLFNVLYFTCKKVSDIVQLSECSSTFPEDSLSAQVMENQSKETTNDLLEHPPNCSSNKLFNTVSSTNHGKEIVSARSLVKDARREAGLSTLESPALHADVPTRATAHSSSSGKSSPKKKYLKRNMRECYKPIDPNSINQTRKKLQSFTGKDSTTPASERKYGLQELQSSNGKVNRENQENHTCNVGWHNETQLTMSLLGNPSFPPPQPLLHMKHPPDRYCIADFAEELAETVVSMATEIAAICLDNSNGKQPWFCSWKRGDDYFMPQALACRPVKRKKETPVVRKHRPPRLSEIKRKTDEHPELKERLMNRVVDESINLDDILDSSNSFASEVAAKIMNLAELSVADNVWQSPNHPRNRLHCDRWSRVNASSCESIPEEDSDSKGPANTLGLLNTLGQPMSRTSSVSKQSSCESITDEFSRFMVNQMENEGREFDLLLDYYAGKNANNILTSALQQVTKKNGHLNVRSGCPSKQSSTESITDEFYRYMLKEIEKENKENVTRNSKDWNSNLLPSSQRSPFCFRQSSMPDSRSSASRLTVNAPIKANSLDGLSRNGHQDSLSVQPISTVSASGLCKSDSYLYQRCRTDQVTDMLIHETWANSIKALMCKNKIIVDDGEVPELDQHPHNSPPQVQQYANRLAANIVESGKTLISIHQDSSERDHATGSNHIPLGMQNISKLIGNRIDLDVKKEHTSSPGSFPTNHASCSAYLREVPLIQIETDQREDLDKDSEPVIELTMASEETREHLNKEKPSNNSLTTGRCPEPEASMEARAVEVPLSSSDESTGSSWCQLATEEENPDDTSSFLQLSERSMSELVEEKTFRKKEPEKAEEYTSALCEGAANGQKDLLVINCDLEPGCPDAELRATLQWIAASELGIPTIYFKKSQENRIEKFLDVVQLVHQKSWKVGDIFHAVVQFCKLHEESRELTPSLFDWLLELG